MNVWKSMSGILLIEITSADTGAALQRLSNENIELCDVTYTGDFTVELMIRRKDLSVTEKILVKQGDRIAIKRKIGKYWHFTGLLRRPVFLVGMLLITALALFLSHRIFFIRVDGNYNLPSDMILERAAECGIRFGTSRRIIRSERMKNALLSVIPELEWAGINTSGCVATIHVREKEPKKSIQENSKVVSSIVAARDGIIVSCTVFSGNPQCKVGQAVKAGQTLVSGYTDCGLTIQATESNAEIIAQTIHNLKAVTPAACTARRVRTRTEKKYSLLIGKKLINFFKDSGICDTTCVKIYKENYMTLPGGFQLPVAWITEEMIYYETVAADDSQTNTFDWLIQVCTDYLLEQMVSGQILTDTCSLEILDGVCRLDGSYTCFEMIGQVKFEENIYSYGNYDGENR